MTLFGFIRVFIVGCHGFPSYALHHTLLTESDFETNYSARASELSLVPRPVSHCGWLGPPNLTFCVMHHPEPRSIP
ncbi:hypothetical protein GGR54DRAFT_28321 [Hypoxylon sp. NC1633]|nr:hypothetical protein GGR54DRAFT_28321 [Hypoxylon sp. NC1633]